VQLARVETLRAGVEAATTCSGAETAKLARYRYEVQLRRADKLARDSAGVNGSAPEASGAPLAAATDCDSQDADGYDADAAVVRTATEAQRQRLVALRANGTIGDAAFQRVEEELDWAELDWAQFLRAGQPADGDA
jgi:CPA1 family monovalent cation:H+ antiporter